MNDVSTLRANFMQFFFFIRFKSAHYLANMDVNMYLCA